MMRRACLLLLVLCLAVPQLAGASAEPLQAAELLAWRESFWQTMQTLPVLNDPSVTHDQAAGETWLYAFSFGMALMTSPSLADGDASALLEAEILTVDVACPRGLRVGATQADVLAAYPNDNPSLQGSTGYAALYVNAPDANGAGGWGWLIRRNQRAEALSYTALAPAQGMEGFRQEYTVTYVLVEGVVDSIVVSGFGNLLTAAQSNANLAAVQDVLAASAFSPSEGAQDAFAGDDLQFAGLSFLTATPDRAIAALGTPQSDETDEAQGLRTLIYAGALLEFSMASGQWTASALLVTDDVVDGPRGLRVGDTYLSVIDRFGEGAQTEPLTYTYTDEAGISYAFACSFVDGILTEYLLYRL